LLCIGIGMGLIKFCGNMIITSFSIINYKIWPPALLNNG
jgi:hypothetical protein